MAANSFEQVLEQARNLSPDEQRQLIRELSSPSAPPNGEQRSLYDALNARGLIGCLKDAPPDLSTNPKYMEGFGRDAQ